MISFSAFAISRANMPQIDDIDGFVKYLNKFGIDSELVSLSNVDSISPTQTDFNQEKVDQIKSNWSRDSKPIIASKVDGFILDGHHRYYSAKQLGEGINVIFVDLPINKLLVMANLFLDKN